MQKSSNLAHVYGPYSPVRRAGNLYFISGQVGIDPMTKHANITVATQTEQALTNLKALLASQELNINNTVKTTVYLKSMGDFNAMNEVYTRFFKVPRPARACVEVSRLPVLADNELLVEIEAVVYRP